MSNRWNHPAVDRERVPRGFGKRGGMYCPVCRLEAYKMGVNEEERKWAWFHEGRPWPCVRKIGATNSDAAGNSVGSGSSSD